MYIDRNQDVFRDIVKHMQGYYVVARDEVHQENLMMDAHFFKLKRLIENLRQHMYVPFVAGEWGNLYPSCPSLFAFD